MEGRAAGIVGVDLDRAVQRAGSRAEQRPPEVVAAAVLFRCCSYLCQNRSSNTELQV